MPLFHLNRGGRPPDDCGKMHVVYSPCEDGEYRCLYCDSKLTKFGVTILPFKFHKDFEDRTFNDLDDDEDSFPGQPPPWRKT